MSRANVVVLPDPVGAKKRHVTLELGERESKRDAWVHRLGLKWGADNWSKCNR